MTPLEESVTVVAANLRFPPHVKPCPDPIPSGATPEDIAEVRALQAKNRRAAFDKSVPAQFRDAFTCDLTADTLGQINGWMDRPGATLLFTGPVGVGKTHAAYAVVRLLADRGDWCAAWTLGDWLRSLQPGGDPHALQLARDVDLLLLDDLGAEKTSEFRADEFTALIDSRVSNAKRTVATTNLNYRQLEERYGPRAMSRLTGGATIVKLSGPDRRRQTW